MYLVDQVKINLRAGRGGDGVVRWRQEKFIPKGGPAGGNGGKGGDVYLRAVRDVSILAKYTDKKLFSATDGNPGEGNKKHGANGEDLYVDVPVGSVVKNELTGYSFEINEVGKEVLVLRGGQGGLGNEHFKSSLNTTPKESTPGKPGDEASFTITLQLFADVGLVGMPNAGKSSLVNALTNAKAKVANYAFTTLDPNLGDFHGYIFADIPGLIEGASEGKGLGHKFLRHIKRTRMIVHLVSFEECIKDGVLKIDKMVDNYKKIRLELEKYDKELAEKKEVILLTKTDCVSEKDIKDALKEFKKINSKTFAVTLFDDNEIKKFADDFIKILNKK